MTSRFSANVRLHGGSWWIILFDVGALCSAALAAHAGSLSIALSAAFLCGGSFGMAEREVSRCAFSWTLPGYRESPRRVLFAVAMLCGAFVTIVSRATPQPVPSIVVPNPVTFPGPIDIVTAGAMGMAIALVSGFITLRYDFSVWFFIWFVGRRLPQSLGIAEVSRYALAGSLLAIAIAWRSLDGRLPARRFASRPTMALMGYFDIKRARQYADLAAAYRARRYEPFGSWLVGHVPLGTASARRFVGWMLQSQIGRYPLWQALACVVVVFVALRLIPRADGSPAGSFGYVTGMFVCLLAQYLASSFRQKIVLPLGRRAQFERHAMGVGLAIVVALSLLALANLLVSPAEALLARVGLVNLIVTDHLKYWPSVIAASALVTGFVPLVRSPILAGLQLILLFALGYHGGYVVVGFGPIPSLLFVSLFCGGILWFLQRHYDRGDLI